MEVKSWPKLPLVIFQITELVLFFQRSVTGLGIHACVTGVYNSVQKEGEKEDKEEVGWRRRIKGEKERILLPLRKEGQELLRMRKKEGKEKWYVGEKKKGKKKKWNYKVIALQSSNLSCHFNFQSKAEQSLY